MKKAQAKVVKCAKNKSWVPNTPLGHLSIHTKHHSFFFFFPFHFWLSVFLFSPLFEGEGEARRPPVSTPGRCGTGCRFIRAEDFTFFVHAWLSIFSIPFFSFFSSLLSLPSFLSFLFLSFLKKNWGATKRGGHGPAMPPPKSAHVVVSWGCQAWDKMQNGDAAFMRAGGYSHLDS